MASSQRRISDGFVKFSFTEPLEHEEQHGERRRCQDFTKEVVKKRGGKGKMELEGRLEVPSVLKEGGKGGIRMEGKGGWRRRKWGGGHKI